jgi:hypothetical protein
VLPSLLTSQLLLLLIDFTIKRYSNTATTIVATIAENVIFQPDWLPLIAQNVSMNHSRLFEQVGLVGHQTDVVFRFHLCH